MKALRLNSLPKEMRLVLKHAREKQGLTQAELGRRLGLPQMHISGIERGKITPRFDTLLDLVRALEFDLIMVPRPLISMVNALIRDNHAPSDTPLYAADYYNEEDT